MLNLTTQQSCPLGVFLGGNHFFTSSSANLSCWVSVTPAQIVLQQIFKVKGRSSQIKNFAFLGFHVPIHFRALLFNRIGTMGQEKKIWKLEKAGVAISGEIHRTLGVSHRQAKGLVDARCVTVNGEMVKNYGQRLKEGDEIVVDFDTDTTYHEMPHPSKGYDSDVNILWEDKHLVFLDKPSGILSVPTETSDDTSLADALAEHYRQKGIKRPRIYIAHRLDKFTTGVMVFAKTPEALNGLKDLFKEHDINRIYRAILVGELPENSGSLHDKLVERTNKLRMAVVAKRTGQAKPQGTTSAVTHYRVIERLPGHTGVELKLETGRRNQIRVQFAERGYPLLGDQIYGSSSPLLRRQALHAELLGFRHPVTEETVTVQSELPRDMETALQSLRVRRRVNRAKEGLKGEEGIFKPRITKERIQGRVMRAKRYMGEETKDRGESPNQRAQPRTRGDMDRTKPEGRVWKDKREGYSSGTRTDAGKPRREKGDYGDRPRQTRFKSDEGGQRGDSPKPRTQSRSADRAKPSGAAGHTKRGTATSRPYEKKAHGEGHRPAAGKPQQKTKTTTHSKPRTGKK
jgi:23S rRNA pseudouridine1911/1915/1917 synthase